MALPDIPLPTGSVTISGTDVPIRALSRSEVLHLRTFSEDAEGADAYIVSRGADVSIDEATAWLDGVLAKDGGVLSDAILALSGLLDPQ